MGKSTLFNRLTRSRQSIVADIPGLTRDRHYGFLDLSGHRSILVDTGGLLAQDTDGSDEADLLAAEQSWRAMRDADQILFVTDAKEGLTAQDQQIASRLRRLGKPVWLIINKTEGRQPEQWMEFHVMGFGRVYPVSAQRGNGMTALEQALIAGSPARSQSADAETYARTPVAILGRPNVGKSTLVNRLTGEERVVTASIPGTTRDPVRVPLDRDGHRYMLIDTAGLRRRRSVEAGAERLSVIRALDAIENALVCVVLMNAQEGVTTQDQRLVALALDRGRAVVLALNKWDGLDGSQKFHAISSLERQLAFASFARIVKLSALHGTGVGELMDAVNEAAMASRVSMSTADLNRTLEELVSASPPPIIRGRRIKLRYAHQGGQCPPTIVIHGTQAPRLPESYRRYLTNRFREIYQLYGTPLKLHFQSPENPFSDRRPKGSKHKNRATQGSRKRRK